MGHFDPAPPPLGLMITKFSNVPPLIKIAVNNGPVLELTQLCIYHKTIRPGGITYCQMVGKHAF